jgi:formate hydrogenlyase subunit 3/multisubunit Na+/H+ antiporter MnhD subunit
MMLSIATLITVIALVFLAVTKGRTKGWIAVSVVLVNAGLTSWIAFQTLIGNPFETSFPGGYVFEEIPVRIDSLSGWFLLTMNLTMVTGIVYGVRYMAPYNDQSSNMTLHYASYIVNHLSMIAVYSLQHSLAFLCAWELMAISAFLMVIFEHGRMEVLKAGINYIIQSHLCIVFLTIGFIWVSSKTGSYDFAAIGTYSGTVIPSVALILFGCFFVGFSFKAGFVPFHTWLPYAHPAAPAHVSGVMSGVIIKLGIFGILRMLLLMNQNHLVVGYAILTLSLITGIYGVILAIIQHNLKKLLAYHSIENIGIIGIGIGLGCIGMGLNKPYLAFAGFAGALLHTFNHSLFKSLLFYAAGTVLQSTHTANIEKLGGLIKKLPHTATFFLVTSLAICGLPPLNGFISEFMIYSGLFSGIRSDQLTQPVIIIISIFGLAIIGGLAMLCFTKAFSIVFLGTERHPIHHKIHDQDFFGLVPQYIVALFIIAVGLLPQLFINIVGRPVSLFVSSDILPSIQTEFIHSTRMVSLAAWLLILLSLLVLAIKKVASSTRNITTVPTWGCGYTTPSPRLQYTANSFVRSFRKLIRPLLIMNKEEDVIEGVFPRSIHSETRPYDKLEALLIDKPTTYIRGIMGRFSFVQNGSVQYYISYGVIFIAIAITIPLLVHGAMYLINIFKQI